MTKEEVYEILENVQAHYDHFEITQVRIDAWHRVLKDYEKSSVLGNLDSYALENSYPPKVKDLIKGIYVSPSYNIPNVEETRKILDSYKVDKPATEKEIQELKKTFGKDFFK